MLKDFFHRNNGTCAVFLLLFFIGKNILKLSRKRLVFEQFLFLALLPFKGFGFAYAALDLQGYRTGSLNETLERSGPQASA